MDANKLKQAVKEVHTFADQKLHEAAASESVAHLKAFLNSTTTIKMWHLLTVYSALVAFVTYQLFSH